MKLIKPQTLGFLGKAYGVGHQYAYSVASYLFFDLQTYEVLPEAQQWSNVGKVLSDSNFDEGISKVKCEYLVAGSAYELQSNMPQTTVSARVGMSKKTLTVFGERLWQRNLLGQKTPSTAQTLASPVPLNYQSAYGGAKFKNNPIGTGFDGDSQPPQVELEAQPISRIKQTREPACFLPIPMNWPQRQQYQGKYDSKWFAEYFPAFAPDTDKQLFNCAPRDQQFDSPLQGGEPFELIGLHPDIEQINGYLPRYQCTAFVSLGGQLSQVAQPLETVWFFPEMMLGVLIYRGQTTINNLAAQEVESVMLAYENYHDIPRSESYYHHIYALRTDSSTALGHASHDRQLTPQLSEQEILRRERALILQQEDKQQQDEHAPLMPIDFILREDLDSGNGDLNPLLNQQATLNNPELIVPSSPLEEDETAIFTEQDAKNNYFSSTAFASREDYQKSISSLRAQQLAISSDDLLKVDKRAGYWLRNQCLKDIQAGNDTSWMDLTGINLSTLTVTNVNFENSILSYSDLTDTTFENCNFSDCTFCHSLLQNAVFKHCQFNGAYLAFVNATQSKFIQCTLHNAQWKNTNLSRTNIERGHLDNNVFYQCNFIHSRFSKTQLGLGMFSNSNLLDCQFDDNELKQVTFSDCNICMSRWNDCDFKRTVFQTCNLTLSTFEGVQSERLVMSTETNLTGINFHGITATQTSFRSLSMRRVRISKSDFTYCDFSETSMIDGRCFESRFEKCIMANSNLSRGRLEACNFYGSSLRGVNLTHSDVIHCNWYEADLMFADYAKINIKNARNFSKVAQRDLDKIGVRT